MPTLEITTMIGCPMRCTFCPQDKLISNYPADAVRALSLDNFKTIVAKLPPHVRIDFSGMSEPWASRLATDMLDHALAERRNVAVYSTLQGMRDPERVADLLRQYARQVEVVVVHLPDSRGNMRGFKDSDQYRQALEIFRKLKGVRFMTMAESSVAGSADMKWNPITRAGNLDLQAIEGQDITLDPVYRTPVTCSFTPFYDQNVVLPNGDVVLCCMDYSVKHKLGNLLLNDYYELFSNVGISELHAENMKFGQGDSLCKTCSRARPHDVGDTKQYWKAQ
jgi:hypothetical protein